MDLMITSSGSHICWRDILGAHGISISVETFAVIAFSLCVEVIGWAILTASLTQAELRYIRFSLEKPDALINECLSTNHHIVRALHFKG